MKDKLKAGLPRITAVAVGLSAALAVGALFPKTDKNEPVKSGIVETLPAKTVDAPAAMQVKASPAAAEKLELAYYRKAGINEYAMSSVTTTSVAKKSAADSGSEDAKSAPVEDFNVVIPEDGTEVYDLRFDKLNYTKTRSVANEFYTVNDLISGKTVTMEAHKMLCMMVYNEIGDGWDEEAIKAQVVAAYSHLRFNDTVDVIPTVALKPDYTPKIERCVSAVEGQCVYYNGGICNTVYAASSAGYTADCSLIWGTKYAYLKPALSEYDKEDPNWGTVTRFSESEVRDALESKLGFTLSDNVKNWFVVESVHSGKYVRDLSIDGGKAKVSGAAMRKILGLKSSAFEISYSGGVFSFKTYGYGHGVGMPQWGAKLYADHGWSYDQILRHYYINTMISLSEESTKAVARGKMSEEELEKIISSSKIAEADGAGEDPSEDIRINEDLIRQAEEEAQAEKEAGEKETAGKETDEKSGEETAGTVKDNKPSEEKTEKVKEEKKTEEKTSEPAKDKSKDAEKAKTTEEKTDTSVKDTDNSKEPGKQEEQKPEEEKKSEQTSGGESGPPEEEQTPVVTTTTAVEEPEEEIPSEKEEQPGDQPGEDGEGNSGEEEELPQEEETEQGSGQDGGEPGEGTDR